MTSERLREAAALMRERAENSAEAWVGPLTWRTTNTAQTRDSMTALHYTSWRPDVALEVSDLLSEYARLWDESGNPPDELDVSPLGRYFTRVADAYLGAES